MGLLFFISDLCVMDILFGSRVVLSIILHKYVFSNLHYKPFEKKPMIVQDIYQKRPAHQRWQRPCNDLENPGLYVCLAWQNDPQKTIEWTLFFKRVKTGHTGQRDSLPFILVQLFSISIVLVKMATNPF